jgi:HEPN domain-containing protein
MHDPQTESLRWLRQADLDLDAARTLAERIPSLACFHAQQSAEKALKAILYASGERHVLGHSLGELGTSVAEHSPAFERLRSDVTKLDRYYVPTRYPNGLPPGSEPSAAFDADDAAGAISSAAEAVAYARSVVEQD